METACWHEGLFSGCAFTLETVGLFSSSQLLFNSFKRTANIFPDFVLKYIEILAKTIKPTKNQSDAEQLMWKFSASVVVVQQHLMIMKGVKRL